MTFERITDANRALINQFLEQHWFTTTMIVRGTEIDMTKVNGFYWAEEGVILGLVTYVINDGILEIVSLDSLQENLGIGTALVEAVVREAREQGCSKVVLVTTNDNVDAMRFYQKRGFDMARLFRNAMDRSRQLKPEIPLIGQYGIALRHEIEFERILKSSADADPSEGKELA